jgi:hypothetical protein
MIPDWIEGTQLTGLACELVKVAGESTPYPALRKVSIKGVVAANPKLIPMD